MLNLVDDTQIAFQPGSKWEYSSTGFLILGAIIEKVNKQSYFDYIHENIYKPAGMTNTNSYELDKVNSNLAIGYSKELTENGICYRNNIFQHVLRGGPAGGGYSTIKDLLKFDQALRKNILIEQNTKQELFTVKPELNSSRYGYGFSIDPHPITSSVGHGGGFKGISSKLSMYQEAGYTVVILSNYSKGSDLVGAKITYLINCMLCEDKK